MRLDGKFLKPGTVPAAQLKAGVLPSGGVTIDGHYHVAVSGFGLYDPTVEIPQNPDAGDIYVASATANGWTAKNVYFYNGSTFVEISPVEGMQINTSGGILFFMEGVWELIPVGGSEPGILPFIGFHDPSVALPVGPEEGWIYVSTGDGNDWQDGYLYQYSGGEWVELFESHPGTLVFCLMDGKTWFKDVDDSWVEYEPPTPLIESIATPNEGGTVNVIFAGDIASDVDISDVSLLTQPDVPRNVQVAADVDWDGGDIVVSGLDMTGELISETITPVNESTVYGTKAFACVTGVQTPDLTYTMGSAALTYGPSLGIKIGKKIPLLRAVVETSAAGSVGAATLSADGLLDLDTEVPDGSRSYVVSVDLYSRRLSAPVP